MARNMLLPMGITSENVAEAYGVDRDMQDKMAVESHAKAVHASEQGLFDEGACCPILEPGSRLSRGFPTWDVRKGV